MSVVDGNIGLAQAVGGREGRNLAHDGEGSSNGSGLHDDGVCDSKENTLVIRAKYKMLRSGL